MTITNILILHTIYINSRYAMEKSTWKYELSYESVRAERLCYKKESHTKLNYQNENRTFDNVNISILVQRHTYLTCKYRL